MSDKIRNQNQIPISAAYSFISNSWQQIGKLSPWQNNVPVLLNYW